MQSTSSSWPAETHGKILLAADSRSGNQKDTGLFEGYRAQMDGDLLFVSLASRYRVTPQLKVLSSDAYNSSALKLEVYAQRTIGSNDYIGEVEERVEVLLGQKGDGQRRNCPLLRADFSPIDVVRTLSKRDSKGAAQNLECVATFTIISINDPIGATQRQMDEAVEQGKRAMEQMASASPLIEPLSGAAVAATSATAQLSPSTDSWVSLLSKIERFTTIVDRIAEVRHVKYLIHSTHADIVLVKVHPYAKMAWDILSAAHKVRLAILLIHCGFVSQCVIYIRSLLIRGISIRAYNALSRSWTMFLSLCMRPTPWTCWRAARRGIFLRAWQSRPPNARTSFVTMRKIRISVSHHFL
jgi:hypothetical protein